MELDLEQVAVKVDVESVARACLSSSAIFPYAPPKAAGRTDADATRNGSRHGERGHNPVDTDHPKAKNGAQET